MAHRLLHDPDADGWERADFPIVCETCLGPNPYVRMQRIEFGGQCHISGRPYTVFRWRPGNDARYKKTIICQEVAKAKNVCQVCLFDLDYGLPVQVRDTALGIETEDIPQSDVGKEFQLQEQIKKGETDSSFGGARPNDILLQLQRTGPYYKRNQSRICSFFVKGQCTRGAECPYRHEMPLDNGLQEQNIKDRYYGINDPVAAKLLRRVQEMPKLEPPEDKSITTIYVGGVGTDITEDDLRDAFYSYGEITSVKKVESRFCAFINFATRAGAERAAEELHNKLILKGTKLRLMWGRPQAGRPQQLEGAGGREHDPMQPVHAWRAPANQQQQQGPGGPYAGPPPGAPVYYPSMDPTQMGALPKRGAPEEGADGAAEGGKRQRTDASASGTGFGHQGPPPGMPPMPYGMPGSVHMGHMGMMPPMGVMPPPGVHMRPPPGMGPPPGAPPPGVPGPRPPAAAPPPGAPPAAAAAAAAGGKGGSVPAPRPPAGPPPA